MTVEISILNKQGIALAADSAVTVNGFNKKVYNSVNKIFQLSDEVGIMVYGAADYLGVPWKIIISVFKKQHKDEKFCTLEECYQKFIKFIQEDTRFVNKSAEDKFLEEYAKGMLYNLGNMLENRKIELLNKDMKTKVTKLANKYRKKLKDFYQVIMDDEILCKEERFQIDNINLVIRSIFILFLAKRYVSVSGIVIAGYGKEEIFPGCINIEIEGCFEGQVRHVVKSRDQINTRKDGFIVTFAQDDVIKLFMHGISEEYISMVPQLFENKVENAVRIFDKSNLLDKLGEDEKDELLQIAQELDKTVISETTNKLNDYSKKSFVNKVMEMVGILPTKELAQLAESMINITILKRRITDTHEGVGGETDVAVITKEDGFKWIRIKKLYGKDDC